MTIYCNIDPDTSYMEFIYREHWWFFSWRLAKYYWNEKWIFDCLTKFNSKKQWVRTLELNGESVSEALRKGKYKVKKLTAEELDKIIPVEFFL